MYNLERLEEENQHYQDCLDSLQAYIETGRPLGGFLEAVVSNDLKEACARADDINQRQIFDYVKWLYNNAPIGCWGSPENYEFWMEKKREADHAKH
jgi:hypothetical protein